jgi:hypothetical protein
MEAYPKRQKATPDAPDRGRTRPPKPSFASLELLRHSASMFILILLTLDCAALPKDTPPRLGQQDSFFGGTVTSDSGVEGRCS